MGLFDFFKRKTELDEITDEMVDRMFPGGPAERLFKSKAVVELSNGKLALQEALSVYSGALIRIKLSSLKFNGESHLGPDVDKIFDGIKSASSGKLSSFEAFAIFYYAIFDRIDSSLEIEDRIRSWKNMCFGCDTIGCDTNEVPWGIGEFGFDSTNPIPVRGVASNEIYLKQLRTLDGRAILHNRKGSLEVPNVPNKIDEYDISQEGNILCRLYIHPYNRKISRRPPKGFMLVKEDE